MILKTASKVAKATRGLGTKAIKSLLKSKSSRTYKSTKELATERAKAKKDKMMKEVQELLDKKTIRDREDLETAIDGYTKVDHQDINRALRHGYTPESETWLHMDKYLKTQGDYTGISHRGTALKSKAKDLKEGDIIKNRSILSTSRNEDVADNFTDEVLGKNEYNSLLRFDNKNAAGHNIEELSRFPDEEEVLLKPGGLYKVIENAIGEDGDGADKILMSLRGLSKKEIDELSDDKKKKIFRDIMSATGVVGAGSQVQN